MILDNEKLDLLCRNAMEQSMIDEDFRRMLLEDPISALKTLTDDTIPDDFNPKFIENDPSYASTLILPDFIG